MTVGLNQKAKENIRLATEWLADNMVPYDIDKRGKHPAFVFTRGLNTRRIGFSGTPGKYAGDQILRNVQRAVADLEIPISAAPLAKRMEPSRAEKKAIALAPGPDMSNAADAKLTYKGVTLTIPALALGEGAGIKYRNAPWWGAFIKARAEFVRDVYTQGGLTFYDIQAALEGVNHYVTSGALSSYEKFLAGTFTPRVKKSSGGSGRRVTTKSASPRSTRSTASLVKLAAAIMEEIAKRQLAGLYAERDALLEDVKEFDRLERRAESDPRVKALLALVG